MYGSKRTRLVPLLLVLLAPGACSSASPPASSESDPPARDSAALPDAPSRHDAGAPVASDAGADVSAPLPDAAPPLDGHAAIDDAAVTADGPPVDAGTPGVRFVARVDRSNPAGPRFAWSGSTILARFTGSSIGVRLAGATNYFAVRIDGMLLPTVLTISAGKTDYPLAANLGAGPHELSIFRRSEARGGDTTFLGLILDPAGTLLAPPPAPDRRLEIIGDSTTCGYGVDGKSASCAASPANENYDLAYGPVAARAVGADLVTVAWTAKGMYRNFAGDMNETMPVLYDRTLGVQPAPTWDHAAWIPDAVLINLGDNDFQKGDPGPPFVAAYTAFVKRLRGYYPQALIICGVGPKLSDPELGRARQYVMAIVSTLQSAGDTKVDFLELPQARAGEGFGCGGHASAATHKHMGETLAAELQAKLGW
jgi:lysophospholipase L1-like esterase